MYTIEERAKIVEFYFASQNSIVQTQRKFRNFFNTRNAPSRNQVRNLVARFRSSGSVSDLSRSGRPLEVQSQDNIERVRESVNENPETSTRKRATQLQMSRTSLRRIMKKKLLLFPYKIQMVHEILPQDYATRLRFCAKLTELLTDDPDLKKKIIMTDEAHFHLSGYVNKQNFRIWGTENPRVIQQRPLHPLRVTVWCGISADKIYGPYFFQDEDGNALTVNGERYRAMLENFLFPELDNTQEMWFQQDGATSHTARETMNLLRTVFGNRIVSRFGDVNWPSRSPDLTPPDFFLWGYLKDRVYANKPQGLQQLKENIINEIIAIDQPVLASVMDQVQQRAAHCEEADGRHLADIIFKI